MPPVVRHYRLAVLATRIAGKQEPGVRIREDSAVETLIEPRLVENSRLEILGVRRQIGFPSQTRNHGQVRIGLPGILEVHADVAFAGVPPNKRLLLELRG